MAIRMETREMKTPSKEVSKVNWIMNILSSFLLTV